MSKSGKEKATTRPAKEEEEFLVPHTQGFDTFLRRLGISLVTTSYKANLLITLGSTQDGRLSCYYTAMSRPMACAYDHINREIWVSTRFAITRMCKAPDIYNEAGEEGGGAYDAAYVPRLQYIVGDQDVHQIVPATFKVNAANLPGAFYVSTKFSGLSLLDPNRPAQFPIFIWKPPFISELKPEDRCHFNGICCVNNTPKYATCICESDAHDGWRDHRPSGGVVIDMVSNEIICRGLSMPHSPTIFNDELYILNSGSGELGVVQDGVFVPKVFLPGFLRGLVFHGRYAFVGSSHDRHENRFQGLQLGENLKEKQTTTICGLFVVDTATWVIAHKAEFTALNELYDLDIVPERRIRVHGEVETDALNWFNPVDEMPEIAERASDEP